MLKNTGIDISNDYIFGTLIRKEFIFDKKLLNHPNVSGDGVIKSMQDLKEAYKKGGQGNKKELIYNKMLKLKHTLEAEFKVSNLDPIQYIIQLYFGKEPLSVQTIFLKLNDKGLNYSSYSGIEKLLKSFGWKLRESDERLITKRVKAYYPKEAINRLIKLEDNNKIKFLEWILENLKESKNPKFDLEHYNKLESETLRADYLLIIFYGTSLKYLKNTSIPIRIIIKYLSPIIDEITEKLGILPVKLYYSGIENLFKKYL